MNEAQASASRLEFRPFMAAYCAASRLAPWIRQPLDKAITRLLYESISRFADTRTSLTFINYGFARVEETAPAAGAGGPVEYYSARLYEHVASPAELAGKDVLEVGCGRGGGAAFLTRTFRPRRYVGVDLAPRAVAFCRRHHQVEGLSFRQADAEALPFPAESFDAVVNVESSHHYPSVETFFREVHRVLRPDGHFLYACICPKAELGANERKAEGAGLTIVEHERITPNVIRALELTSQAKLAVIRASAPSFFRPMLENFAAVSGSPTFEKFRGGEWEYFRLHLRPA